VFINLFLEVRKMCKWLVVASVVLWSVSMSFGAWSQPAWDFMYDGQYYPTTWYSVSTPTGDYTSFSQYFGGPDSYTSVVADSTLGQNVTRFNTLGSSSNAAAWISAVNMGDRNGDGVIPNTWSGITGYTYEAKIKLNSTDVSGTGAVSFQLADNVTSNNFWLMLQTGADQKQYASLYAWSVAGLTEVSEGWHTYRITVGPDSTKLYIDGSTVAAQEILAASYRNDFTFRNLTFGDGTSGQNGSFDTAYIKVYGGGMEVPEPFTMALLGLGAIGLIRRK
jgi:hypothetical protein